MSYLYIDSSVLVSLAVGDRSRSKKIIQTVNQYEHTISSEIAVVEGQSGISHLFGKNGRQRAEAEQNLNRILSSIDLFGVSSLVLGHARALVRSYRQSLGLRSLDAIHVATSNLIRQQLGTDSPVVFEYLTADSRQNEVFTAEGYVGTLIH